MFRIKVRLGFSCLPVLLLSTLVIGLSFGQDEKPDRFLYDHGGVVRGDAAKKEIALVFAGHEFADGGAFIRDALKRKAARAGFFFTGDFYRNPAYFSLIKGLRDDGHYLGAHSDRHLLYCSWENRDQLLVTREEFTSDILHNYEAMDAFGIAKENAPYFIPPYEWYNAAIVGWAKELGLVLFNFSPGTLSNADYTTPDMSNYRSSVRIYQSVIDFEKSDPHGLNGFILLVHIGTHPDRRDKFYRRLEELLTELEGKGYRFVRIDELIKDGE
jgi:peptidoglycan/xylan/chitin deacetylase (PgdA/CDA1 family)